MENNMNLTNKKKALSIYKWTLRKYLPFSIAYWILLFITFPLVELFGMIVCSSESKTAGMSTWEYYIDSIEDVAEVLPGTFFASVVVLFSAILAIMAFSYMHNKRAVDLFGSFPVSRRTLFFSRYFAVITACAVPVIVFGGIGALLTLKGTAMIVSMKIVGILLLEVIANVSFVALISLCCGTVADVMISYGIINIIYPIFIALCYNLPKMILPGISEGYVPNTVFTLLCPMGSPFVAIFGTGCDFHIIWWIVLSAVLMAGCYVLCKKRKAETAQNAFAFAIVEIVIKFATCFTAGVGIGWLLSYMGLDVSKKSQYIWFVIGLVGGIMVSNVLLHLIFHRGLSKYKRSLIECGAVFVTGLAFLLIITSGAFGFDTRVPDAKNVKAVSIDFGGSQTFTINGENILEQYTSDEEIINGVVELHNQIVEKVVEKKAGLYSIVNSPYVAYYNWGTDVITIAYKLDNGRTMRRSFDIPRTVLKVSTDLEELGAEDSQILSVIPFKYLESIDLTQYKGNGFLNSNIGYTDIWIDDVNKAKWEDVIDALKKDIKEKGLRTEEDVSVYNMHLRYYNRTGECVDCDIYVGEDYENTIKALEEVGYANVGYHSLKSNYYGQDFENTDKIKLKEERTIYFEVPDSWEADAPVQCMQFRIVTEEEDWEEKYRFTDVDDASTKCEKVSENVWKYTLKSVENTDEEFTYDYIMFYQFGKRLTYTTSQYKVYAGEKYNMLKVDNSRDMIYDEYGEEISDDKKVWVEYKEN